MHPGIDSWDCEHVRHGCVQVVRSRSVEYIKF